MGARVFLRGRDFGVRSAEQAVGGQTLALGGLNATYDDMFIPLFGAHQVENAAAAIVACEAFLNHELNEDALRQALAGIKSPGRLEVVSRHPLVVLDGAHNPNAAASLSAALPEAFVWKRLHLVVGVLETKDVAGILAPLAPRVARAYACTNSNPKSLDPERMAAACDAAGITADAFPTVQLALDAAEAEADEDDLILVTGSLYTVADARPRYVPD
jgi:dihydrofolate synthase/folylpolyglutamate synthase